MQTRTQIFINELDMRKTDATQLGQSNQETVDLKYTNTNAFLGLAPREQCDSTPATIRKTLENGAHIDDVLRLIKEQQLPARLTESLIHTANIQWRKATRFTPAAPTRPAVDHQTSSAERTAVGTSILAPILYSFYKRLFARLGILRGARSPNKIYFLAREGYLLQKGFEEIKRKYYTELSVESCYMMASRAMLSKATIHLADAHDLIKRHGFKGSLKTFLQNRLSLDRIEIDRLAAEHPFLNEAYSPHNCTQALSVAADLFALNEESRLYLEYLDSIGFLAEKSKVVIDLGYSGTIQDLLSILINADIEGYYLITTPNTASHSSFPNCKHGLIASNVSWGSCSMLDKSILIETLLTAPNGSCIGISKESGNYRFRYGAECATQHRFDEISEIFDKALEAVSAMFAARLQDLGHSDLAKLYSSLLSSDFFANPTPPMRSLLQIEDAFGGNLITDVNEIISQ